MKEGRIKLAEWENLIDKLFVDSILVFYDMYPDKFNCDKKTLMEELSRSFPSLPYLKTGHKL